MKKKRLLSAAALLLLSCVLLSTASFAWFSMNEAVNVAGFELEAYSDSLYLQISESEQGPFLTELDLSDRDDASLRLVTLGHLTDGGMTVTASRINDGSRYSSALGISYYKKVETDPERNDTLEGDNYICINSKLRDASSVEGFYRMAEVESEISFSVITDSSLKFDGSGGPYYARRGNDYIPLRLDTDGTPDPYEIPLGTSLRGYFTASLGTPEPSGARYDGTSAYYKVGDDGVISPVGALTLGTLLDGYFTISASDDPQDRAATADGATKYYIKNSRGDYVCIGAPEAGTNLEDYYYWGRAYSSDMNAVQQDNTLNVIKQPFLDSYYLHDTLYIRLASINANGSNLRLGSVSIDGEDSLNSAIRIFISAKNGEGEEAFAIYNNHSGEITHLNGEGNLFDTILGEAQELVCVDVYIYFDGTDPSAKTQDVRLSGQSVALEFEIDLPDYMM